MASKRFDVEKNAAELFIDKPQDDSGEIDGRAIYESMRELKKKQRPPKEILSRHLQLLTKPSTYEKLSDIAYDNDMSLNKLTNKIFEQYIAEYERGNK